MSAAIWSGPSAFSAPSFGAGTKYDFSKWSPDQLASAFKSSGMPSPVGVDFGSGKRDVDLLAQQTGDAVPKPAGQTQEWLDLYKAMSPLRMQEMEQASNLAADLSARQLSQLYPYLSAAGAESTARNLAASQAYRRFSEQLPSNVQNIMASKQAQMQSAQAGEADLMRAVAAQQQAAKDFAGRFAGQYVSYS